MASSQEEVGRRSSASHTCLQGGLLADNAPERGGDDARWRTPAAATKARSGDEARSGDAVDDLAA